MCDQGSRVLKARSQSNFFILFSENLKLSRQRCPFQKTQLPAELPMMKISTVVVLETWPSSSLMLLQLRKKPTSPLLESVFYDWLTNKAWQNRHHSNFSATALTVWLLSLSSLGAHVLGSQPPCWKKSGLPKEQAQPSFYQQHQCTIHVILPCWKWIFGFTSTLALDGGAETSSL